LWSPQTLPSPDFPCKAAMSSDLGVLHLYQRWRTVIDVKSQRTDLRPHMTSSPSPRCDGRDSDQESQHELLLPNQKAPFPVPKPCCFPLKGQPTCLSEETRTLESQILELLFSAARLLSLHRTHLQTEAVLFRGSMAAVRCKGSKWLMRESRKTAAPALHTATIATA
jgi:hypothetical protein